MSPQPMAVVLGAASGIGRATAERLLADGFRVAVLSRRRERLQELAEAHGERIVPVPLDATDEAAWRQAGATIAAASSAVAVLVTAAGDFSVSPIAETSREEFERVWRVNVLSKFLAVRELLPLLRRGVAEERRPGAIIHISSLAAHQDFPNESAYGSAMHAVVGLARSQDAELRPQGIRVAAVSPGLVRTELTERSGFSEADLARALTPEALAASIAYLVTTIRAGGYIPEIFHVPQGL